MKLIIPIMIVAAAWYFWPDQHTWTGYLFEDASDRTAYTTIGTFPAFTDCKLETEAAGVRLGAPYGSWNYTCGRNCSNPENINSCDDDRFRGGRSEVAN